MFNQKLTQQLAAAFAHYEMQKFTAAFAPWYLRDMQQHRSVYQPTIDELSKAYPEVPQLWEQHRQGRMPQPLPRQEAFDAMLTVLEPIALSRMPIELKRLYDAASAVILNGRRN